MWESIRVCIIMLEEGWCMILQGRTTVFMLVLKAQILGESAGLLQGSRSSVVRASTAKVGGPWVRFSVAIPMHFFLQFVSILIYHQLLTTSSYRQLLLISIVTKIIVYSSLLRSKLLEHGRSQLESRLEAVEVPKVSTTNHFLVQRVDPVHTHTLLISIGHYQSL